MKNRKKIVVGNWKMNVQTVAEAKEIVRTVKRKTVKIRKTDIVFCPPVIYLSSLSSLASGKYKLGVQNVFYGEGGPYTGEISAAQLKQFKISHVILGHSERRKMGETDEIIVRKVSAVLRAGQTPILCIGESVHDDEGEYLSFLKNQLTNSLAGISKGMISDVVIAYEPIWAVGGKLAMSPRDVHETTLYIKKCLREMFGSYAESVFILYGGSVNLENAGEIIHDGFVDGLLIGKESLEADDFSEIIKKIDSIK